MVFNPNKKTWTLIVYVLSGIAKHLEPHIRVKAHVLRREHPIFYSCGSLKMAISIELEFKRTLFMIMKFLYHRHYCFNLVDTIVFV